MANFLLGQPVYDRLYVNWMFISTVVWPHWLFWHDMGLQFNRVNVRLILF